MGEMTTKPVDILLDLVSATGKRGLPLTFAVRKLEEKLRLEGYANPAEIAQETILEALESCSVDKIIDEPESKEESPSLRPIWLLRLLSPEESSILQRLSPGAKALLKILRESEWDGSIGVIRENLALEKLREKGFNFEHVPRISERTGIFFKPGDGNSIPYCYLLPEDERSEEFKASMKEADEELMEREWREDRAIAREEAQERRKTARKKKATAEKKKKSSTNKKPE